MKPRSSSGSIRKKRWKNWILILTQRFPFAHISAGSELPDVAVRNWIIARRRCSSHNMESVIETGGGKIYRHMVECDHWFSGVYTGDLFSWIPITNGLAYSDHQCVARYLILYCAGRCL